MSVFALKTIDILKILFDKVLNPQDVTKLAL